FETLLTALRLQRDYIVQHYRTAIQALAREYSQSVAHAHITPDLQQSLEHDVAHMPNYAQELGAQVTLEPYRAKLSFIWKRLKATRSVPPPTNIQLSLTDSEDPDSTDTSDAGAPAEKQTEKTNRYKSAEELLADLHLIRESLQADG